MKAGDRIQGTPLARRRTSGTLAFSLQPLAFTLIEFIGALAIITLIGAALVPVIIRQIDRAAKTAEIQNLSAIASNFVAYVRSTQTIPTSAANSWAPAVATYMNKPVSDITVNSRGVARVCLYDNSGWLNANVPYSQTVSGSAQPPTSTGCRILIISSMDRKNALPALNVAADFDTTWNWDPDVDSVPGTGHWTSWAGSRYDIAIQRINLQQLFHHVLLFSGQSAPIIYSINNGTPATINSAPSKFDGYFLDGSVLGLYTNTPSPTNLQTSEIINRDMSRYLATTWSDQPGPGPPATTVSAAIDNVAYAFMNSPSPPSTKRGDNTIGIAGSLLAYMSSYAGWANMSPCFSFLGQGQNNVSKVPEAAVIITVNNCMGGSGSGVSSCLIIP